MISSLRKTFGLTTGAFWMSGIWPRQTFYTNGLIKFAQWPWLWFKRTFWMPVFFPCSGKDGSCVVSTLYFDFIWYFSNTKIDNIVLRIIFWRVGPFHIVETPEKETLNVLILPAPCTRNYFTALNIHERMIIVETLRLSPESWQSQPRCQDLRDLTHPSSVKHQSNILMQIKISIFLHGSAAESDRNKVFASHGKN